MIKLQQKSFDLGLAYFARAGIQGFAIIDADGNKHGDLEVVLKSKKAPLAYKRGVLRAHITAQIKDMDINDIRLVDLGDLDFDHVYASVSSTAFTMWGPKAHQVTGDKEAGEIYIQRISPLDDDEAVMQ